MREEYDTVQSVDCVCTACKSLQVYQAYYERYTSLLPSSLTPRESRCLLRMQWLEISFSIFTKSILSVLVGILKHVCLSVLGLVFLSESQQYGEFMSYVASILRQHASVLPVSDYDLDKMMSVVHTRLLQPLAQIKELCLESTHEARRQLLSDQIGRYRA